MDFKTFNEQIFFSTLRIELPFKGSMGTGFLVETDAKNPGGHHYFLVSNKHVLSDPNDQFHIVFHTKDDIKDLPSMDAHFNVAINQIAKGAYFTHPSDSVDLACLHISTIFNVSKAKLFIKAWKINQIADFTEEDLEAGKEIYFIGYPDNRYDHAHNLPILRSGRIASIPSINFENEPQFLVDAQVHSGSSGSPVYTVLGNHYKLIGVITRTMIKGQKLETIETTKTTIVPQVLGIGLAYKSTCVKELIDYALSEVYKQY